MAIRVYAVVGSRLGSRQLSGIRRAGLRLVTDGPTAALVVDCDGIPSPSERALREHDAVVQRLARLVPAVLPARFASVVDSERALAAILEASAEDLRVALHLVNRQCQMTLRLFGRSVAQDPSGLDSSTAGAVEDPGTRYLTRRARAQTAHELEPLRSRLAGMVTAERIARHDCGPLMLTAYHLIPRGAVAAYRRLLRRHSAALGWRVVSSGPWPPYAFAPELRR